MTHLTISSDGGGCLPQFDREDQLTRMWVNRFSTLMETLRALSAKGSALDQILPTLISNVADL